MFIKHVFTCLGLFALLLGFSGCAVEPVEHFLTGTVVDYYSAVAVPNASVTFGDAIVLTDSLGRFSISLGTSGGLVSGDFAIHKSGYYPYFYENSSVDSSNDCDIYYTMSGGTGSTPKTLSGCIYYHDGSTELSPGTNYSISIMNERGQQIDYESGAYPASGYSMETDAQARNCIIYVRVMNTALDCTYFCMTFDNDLSVAAPDIDFFLRNPAEDVIVSDLTVNADNFGASYYGAIEYLYQKRVMPVIRKESGFYQDLDLDLSTSSSDTVDIVDLFPGSELIVIQAGSSTATGHTNQLMSTSSIDTPVSNSSINLPALVENGPAGIPNPASIIYLDGVISIDPVTEANLYIFDFVDEGTGMQICTVTSTENSIALPAWLSAMLGSKTVTIIVNVANQSNYMRIEKFNYFIGYGLAAMPGHIQSGVSGIFKIEGYVIP